MSVDKKVSPHADFIAAWVWVAFGLAVLIGAWRMDRLESQGATVYTAPGLVPGILGAVLLLLGLVLAWRGVHGGALAFQAVHAPGLVPGILGAVLLLLGLVLAWRAARAGGHRLGSLRWGVSDQSRAVVLRVSAFLVLALGYAAGVVGRGGVPFWLATFVFVTASVLAFDWARRRTAGQAGRGVLVAVAVGAGTAFVVSYVFQEVFLVRLP
jgi:Tripartite tricarboxylate transporter TctB family